MPKDAQTITTLHSSHTLVTFKILQVRLQQYVNHDLPVVQAGFRKGKGTRDQIANICWIIEKAREKFLYFCFIDYAKALQSMGSLESDTTEWLQFHFSLSCIGEGHGNPLQCSCLENPRDGEAWWAAVYGVAQSQTQLKWLSSSSSSKAFDCVDHNKLWKILKEMGIPDHLICLLRNLYKVKKQPLEVDMKQQTGSK